MVPYTPLLPSATELRGPLLIDVANPWFVAP